MPKRKYRKPVSVVHTKSGVHLKQTNIGIRARKGGKKRKKK